METGIGAVMQKSGMALKPSLEGWKLSSYSRQARASSTLKPSLEGWKHVRVIGMDELNETLKPSLEGWKPGSKSK